MTGFCVRISRAGTWQALDIAELTDNELQAFFEEQGEAKLTRWAKGLAAWIRDNVKAEPNGCKADE